MMIFYYFNENFYFFENIPRTLYCFLDSLEQYLAYETLTQNMFSKIKYFPTWSKIAQNYDPDGYVHFASDLKTNGNRKENLGLENLNREKIHFLCFFFSRFF